MLGIVLLILRIIGLLLLVIAGILLALVLLVLFLPIPYRLQVSGDSAQPDQFLYRVNIFGIQILPIRERKRRRKHRNKHTNKQEDSDERQKPPEHQPDGHAQPKAAGSQEEPANTHQPTDGQTPTQSGRSDGDAGRETSRPLKHPPGGKKNKEKHASGNIREKLKQIYTQVTDAGNHRAVLHICSEIVYLLRHYGPRRVRADVSFSLGDPANTGYATAALSVCPFSYGKGCCILPDFESEQMYLRGRLDLRGHVRGAHAFIAGLRLLCDKDIRKAVKTLRRKRNQ